MRIHIKDLPRQITIAFAAKTNMSISSKPALGKTWGVLAAQKLIHEYDPDVQLALMDMATMSPNDVVVYMPDPKTGTLRAYPNAEMPNHYTDPDSKGIIFFDEYGLGDPTTISASQKYINRESIGGKLRMPDGWMCIGATNRLSDKSNVRQQPRAWLSRMEQWEAYSTPDYDCKIAKDAEWFPIIVDFFKKFPHLIDNYEEVYEETKRSGAEQAQLSEEGKRGVWANKRSWKRLSDIEYSCAQLHTPLHPLRAHANVGQAVGQQYMLHRAAQESMLNIDDILKDPKHVPIPDRMDQQYILLTMLAVLVKTADLSAVDKFLDRIGGDLRVMAITRMAARWRKEGAAFNLPATPEFKEWVRDPQFADLVMGAS